MRVVVTLIFASISHLHETTNDLNT